MNPTQRKNSEQKVLTLQEIARLVDGELLGDGQGVITGVAGIQEAKAGEITFLSNAKYLPFLEKTQASAVITSKEIVFSSKFLIRVSNPSQAVNKVISFFHPARPELSMGIHPTAVVDPTVCLGKRVFIGAHVFIGADCHLGEDVWIYPNVTVYSGARIGNRVIIHSGTVIGSDGFGYETVEGEHLKIPHTGNVVIEDDVEIGANVCVDRGRLQKTWIQRGTKIDNLVQIAHNVVIGPNCLIVSQAGISGSTELGKNVIIAGQAGIVGHIKIGDEAIVGAGAGVTKSVPDKTVVLGGPARPIQEQKKIFALIARLPELFNELSEIKKRTK